MQALGCDLLSCLETRFQVGENVLDVLEAHGESHQSRCNTRGELLLGSELRVGGGGGVNDEASHVTDVGHVAKQ